VGLSECQGPMDYNARPTSGRLGSAVVSMIASGIVGAVLTTMALTVVISKFVLICLCAVAPFIALFAVLPGSGRRWGWMWLTTLVQAVVVAVGLAFVLSMVLTITRIVLDATAPGADGTGGRPPLERRAALASCLLLLPTFVHGLTNWSPSSARPPRTLSAGLLAAVRENVPPGGIVYADPQTSYRLGAYVPVRVCVNPISHVADTVDNRPRDRARTFLRAARAGDVTAPARACGAEWLVVDLDRWPALDPDDPVYRDERWALARV